MRRVIHSAMIVLMILWTAALIVDVAQTLLASGELMVVVANESDLDRARRIVQGLWHDFWGLQAQARAIIWGVPMIVFALITALSHR